MIAVVDYGVGNLFSLSASLDYVGLDTKITSVEEEIRKADKIILPGVGAFKPAMDRLLQSGLKEVIDEEVKNGKPLLGICLGMQLLFERSHEYGIHEGLGYIKGEVIGMEGRVRSETKVPQMGWNRLNIKKDNPILKYIKDGEYVYFVHSYFASGCDSAIVASVDYDVTVPAIVNCNNVYGTQFHPEKSSMTGLGLLKAFDEL